MYYTVKIWLHLVLNLYTASSYFLFIPPRSYTAPFVKFQVLKFLYDQQWFKPFGHLFVLILRVWETQKCFLFTVLFFLLGFPGGSGHKESACNVGDQGSITGLGRFLWRRKWQPILVFLPGESQGWRSLVGYSLQGRKQSDMTEWLHCLYFFFFLLIFENM